MPSGHPLNAKDKRFIERNQDRLFPSQIADKLGLNRATVVNLINKKKEKSE